MIIMATDMRPPLTGPSLPPRQPAVQSAKSHLAKSRALLSALYVTVLLATVAAGLLPAVLFQPHSRIFLLKLAAVVLFASMPGLLYVQFIRFKGPSLYDEFVINLFRLRIDQYRNLPMPPKHTSYYAQWDEEHSQLDEPGTDNLYRRKFETVY